MLTLYHGGTSVCSFKVRLALEEKGIPWESHHLLLATRENQTDAYRKINPKMKVPAIVHDGVALAESNVINEYLDDRFPEVSLRPADPMDRARMRLWTRRLDESVHEMTVDLTFCISTRYRRLALPKDMLEEMIEAKPDPVERANTRERIMKGVEARMFGPSLARLEKLVLDMEKALSESQWLAGDSYSLADIGLTPYITRFEELHLHPLWGKCSHLSDWHARIKARANYAPARDPWIEAAHLEEMAEDGAREWPRIREMLTMCEV